MATEVTARHGKLLSLLEISMSRSVHQLGVAPSGTLTIGIPLSPAAFSWRRADVQEPAFCPFGNARDFDVHCPTAFRALTLSMAEDELVALADQLGLDLADALRRSDLPMRHRDRQDPHVVAVLARRFLTTPDLAFDPSAQEDIATRLLLAMTLAGAREDRSSWRSRARAVRSALALMEQRADESLPISLLCREVSVSWATLDRAFKERFGIGPKAYFNRLRLNRVRACLLERSPGCRIADIANRWGYWHMGQFARDYRRLFGELPSRTAHQAAALPHAALSPALGSGRGLTAKMAAA